MFWTKYAWEILKRLDTTNSNLQPLLFEIGMKLSSNEHSKPVDATLYRQLVWNFIYLTTSRTDLSYVAAIIS
jgi:hypothetical protein